MGDSAGSTTASTPGRAACAVATPLSCNKSDRKTATTTREGDPTKQLHAGLTNVTVLSGVPLPPPPHQPRRQPALEPATRPTLLVGVDAIEFLVDDLRRCVCRGVFSDRPVYSDSVYLGVTCLPAEPTIHLLTYRGSLYCPLPDHYLNQRFSDRPIITSRGATRSCVVPARQPSRLPYRLPFPPSVALQENTGADCVHGTLDVHEVALCKIRLQRPPPSEPVYFLSSAMCQHSTAGCPNDTGATGDLPPLPTDSFVQRRKLAELVGNLQFVAPALHAGSTFLRTFYDALHGLDLEPSERPGTNYNAKVPLPNGFWQDFDSYKRILREHTGRRVLRGDWLSIVRAWTDASSAGAGVSILHNDEQGRPLTQLQFLAGVWPRHLALNSSNWRELRTILFTLQQAHDVQELTGERRLDGTVLYVFTDNAVSAAAINRGTSSSPSLLRLVKGLREYETNLGCHVVAVWVPGTAIIDQGTDGLSRGAVDEGAFAADSPDPLTFSPIDTGCPTPEQPFLRAVVHTFPEPAQVLRDPDEWYQRPHPHRATVLVPAPSLARQAIDQALRWRAAHPYTTGVAIVLPDNYASSWGRLSKYFTRVYYARGGTFGRPDSGAGTFVVLYLLPHLDRGHGYATFATAPATGTPMPTLERYRLHLDRERRCTPAEPHHPLYALLADIGADAPPQLPQRLILQPLPDTYHTRGLARARLHRLLSARLRQSRARNETLIAGPDTPDSINAGAAAGDAAATRCLVKPLRVFSETAAGTLQRYAHRHCLWRDAKTAMHLISSVDGGRDGDRQQWRAAICRSLQSAATQLYNPEKTPPVKVHFFRLPYYLWSDFAFGIIPAFTQVPARCWQDNYSSADHEAVHSEIDRLVELGYASAELDGAAGAHTVIPLGAVLKKDTGKPRGIVDATACGLNDATEFLRFKYPAFNDFIGLAYPDCWYWKLDWTDAFFSVPFYQPFRKFFCFQHPRTSGLHQYNVLPFGWRLSPFYYSRLVHAYVDILRLGAPFTGALQKNYYNRPVHHQRMPLLYRAGLDGSPATELDQYCDDGIGFSPSEASGAAALSHALRLVGHLGAIAKASKTVRPAQHGEAVLGLELRTAGDSLTVVIPPDRLASLRTQLDQFDVDYRTLPMQ